MSEPIKPPAFDPRRLADLASRLAPAPAPTAAPQPSMPQQPSMPAPSPQQPSIPAPSMPQQPSIPAPSMPQPGAAARADEVGPPAGTGENVGPPAGTGENRGPAGHPQVDAVLAELERAEQLPPDQQIPVYESVHRTLQETLRSIEQN